MAKARTIYSCTECGATSSKWQGQCPGCEAWNTLVETVAEAATPSSKRFAALAGTARVQTLSEIEAREGKRNATIAIGCTGGKHRSTAMTEACARMLRESGFQVSTLHRDLGKE